MGEYYIIDEMKNDTVFTVSVFICALIKLNLGVYDWNA